MTRMLLAVAAVLLAVAGVAAVSADEHVTFSTNTRIARVGVQFSVTVEGLAGCEGEVIDVGLFDGDTVVQRTQTRVDDAGRAIAYLGATEASVGLRLGAYGDCLGEGVMFSELIIPVVAPVYWVTTPTPTPLPGSEDARFTWGEPQDEYGSVLVGEDVTLSVDGLEDCAGQEIDLGFFAGLWGRDLYERTVVDEGGQASVTLSSAEETGDQRAGAMGECLANGFIVFWGRSFQVHPPLPGPEPGYTPTPVAPQPPVVGTGSAGSSNASPWAAVLAGAGLVAAGAGAFAVAVRRRRV